MWLLLTLSVQAETIEERIRAKYRVVPQDTQPAPTLQSTQQDTEPTPTWLRETDVVVVREQKCANFPQDGFTTLLAKTPTDHLYMMSRETSKVFGVGTRFHYIPSDWVSGLWLKTTSNGDVYGDLYGVHLVYKKQALITATGDFRILFSIGQERFDARLDSACTTDTQIEVLRQGLNLSVFMYRDPGSQWNAVFQLPDGSLVNAFATEN